MDLIGELYGELFDDLEVFTCFADIPEAGTPFGNQFYKVAYQSDVNASQLTLTKTVDAETGERHITEQVTGDFEEGDICLLIDDLITAAGTKLEAIQALKANGIVVSQILVIVDREQGGSLQLAGAGYELVALFTLSELLDFYVAEGLLTAEKADEVRAYIAANQFV
jgi:uridine monophosphate synthetase